MQTHSHDPTRAATPLSAHVRTSYMVPALAVLLAAAAGCGEFETRSIVLDLRVLAVSVDPPEIVSPFDPDDPGSVELDDTRACALVADPADDRRLTYAMRACAPTRSDRCDEPGRPVVEMGGATVEDPERAGAPVELCQILPDGPGLLAVLLDSIEDSAVSGFGGVRVQLELSVAPEPGSGDPADPADQPQYATKQMLYSPKLPPERVANTNPALERLQVTREDGSEGDMPIGRCNEVEPLQVTRGELLVLEPFPVEGAREDYLVPTFDGGSRMFTEYLTYFWYASDGDYSAEVSGGLRDVSGREPPKRTEWEAQIDPERVGDGLDVRLWLVFQDERGGLSWIETCVHVVP